MLVCLQLNARLYILNSPNTETSNTLLSFNSADTFNPVVVILIPVDPFLIKWSL